jgi:hypothetical protein
MLRSIRSITMIGCLAAPLALLASEGPNADQKLAAKIQKSVAKDDSLSATARSVTVTVREGAVTLQGSVQSDEESQAIEGKAESFIIQEKSENFAEPSEIHNELMVAPSN